MIGNAWVGPNSFREFIIQCFVSSGYLFIPLLVFVFVMQHERVCFLYSTVPSIWKSSSLLFVFVIYETFTTCNLVLGFLCLLCSQMFYFLSTNFWLDELCRNNDNRYWIIHICVQLPANNRHTHNRNAINV